jgi:hypothetical protein
VARALVRSVRGSLMLIGSDGSFSLGLSLSEQYKKKEGSLQDCPLLVSRLRLELNK